MAPAYRVLGFTLLPLLRSRIRSIEGREHLPADGGYILAANHQSWIDSPIMGGAFYRSIKKSLRFVAQSSKYRFLGGIPINEEDRSGVLHIALGYLRADHPVVIFPEGNSHAGEPLRVGKTGVARLGLWSGRPIVPVGILGTHGLGVPSSFWWFIRWWMPCRVRIGQPIEVPLTPRDQVTKEQLVALTDRVMRAIAELTGRPFTPTPPEIHA